MLHWYPVPDSSPVFPHPHAFESRNYISNYQDWGDIGEVDEKMTWTPDAYYNYSALTFCGEPEWYLTGIPADAPTFQAPCDLCQLPETLINVLTEVRSTIKSINIRLRMDIETFFITGAFDSSFSPALDVFRMEPAPE